MNYALISTANEVIEYPASPHQKVPNVSFPEDWPGGFIEGWLFVKVDDVVPPTPSATQQLMEIKPVFINARWTRQFRLNPLPKEVVRAKISDFRWNKERAGISLNGTRYATDDVSQTKYLAILMAVSQNPAFSVNWKAEGGFITLHAAEIMALTQTVQAYVQACFNHEKQLADQLDSLDDPNVWATMDIEHSWPTGIY